MLGASSGTGAALKAIVLKRCMSVSYDVLPKDACQLFFRAFYVLSDVGQPTPTEAELGGKLGSS